MSPKPRRSLLAEKPLGQANSRSMLLSIFSTFNLTHDGLPLNYTRNWGRGIVNTKPVATALSTLIGIANAVGLSTIQGFWEIFEPSSSEPLGSYDREGSRRHWPHCQISKSDGMEEFDNPNMTLVTS